MGKTLPEQAAYYYNEKEKLKTQIEAMEIMLSKIIPKLSQSELEAYYELTNGQ